MRTDAFISLTTSKLQGSIAMIDPHLVSLGTRSEIGKSVV